MTIRVPRGAFQFEASKLGLDRIAKQKRLEKELTKGEPSREKWGSLQSRLGPAGPGRAERGTMEDAGSYADLSKTFPGNLQREKAPV